jgi:hypothetical protein
LALTHESRPRMPEQKSACPGKALLVSTQGAWGAGPRGNIAKFQIYA